MGCVGAWARAKGAEKSCLVITFASSQEKETLRIVRYALYVFCTFTCPLVDAGKMGFL